MKHLLLKRESAVYVDWANVYGWRKSLKGEVDPRQLFQYLKTYSEISDVRLYFGEDRHLNLPPSYMRRKKSVILSSVNQ